MSIRHLSLVVLLITLALVAMQQYTTPSKRMLIVSTSTAETHTILYPVVRVIDGDTVEIERDGTHTKVRLIGIDTPEVVDPRKPVQCFGREASHQAHILLDGARVFIETDPSQNTYDKYGRLLAYVFLPDGTFINEYMIAEGYAHEYTYDLPYKYQTEFKAAEKSARESHKGLWAPETCNGNTHQPAKDL
jgi:micrococcal nuclease